MKHRLEVRFSLRQWDGIKTVLFFLFVSFSGVSIEIFPFYVGFFIEEYCDSEEPPVTAEEMLNEP